MVVRRFDIKGVQIILVILIIIDGKGGAIIKGIGDSCGSEKEFQIFLKVVCGVHKVCSWRPIRKVALTREWSNGGRVAKGTIRINDLQLSRVRRVSCKVCRRKCCHAVGKIAWIKG